MADSKQLPVLQGYWRLLEPDKDTMQRGDERAYFYGERQGWAPIPDGWIGGSISETSIVRRRVPPPPTCATCEHWERRDPAYYVKGFCSLLEIDMADCDYCSRHPKAQEVTR